MTKTAIIYARVSTVRQAEEELPITSQLDQCRVKVEALGAEVIRTFIDDGLSGRSDTRPAFQDAILFCELQDVDYLVTWSSSRFARNKVDAGFYKKRLEKVGTSLLYVSMDLDRSTDGGWLLDGVMELFDELYSRQVSADTKRSMLRNAKLGFWNGGNPPFGFRVVHDTEQTKRKRLTPDDAEEQIVIRIFSMRAEGHGAKTIMSVLNGEGILNRSRRWSKNAISDLLRNEAMIGNSVFGRKDRNTGRRRPRSDWIIVPSHDPIVPIELWKEVQRLLDEDAARTDTSSPHSTFLFTGMLECGICGGRLQIESAKGRSRRYHYYNCRSSSQHKQHPPRRIPARDLDLFLVELITRRLFSRTMLEQVVTEFREACGTWAVDQSSRRKSVNAQLNDVERRRSNLYKVLEEHGKEALTLGDLGPRLRELNEQAKNLQASLAEIDAERPPEITIDPADLDELADFLKGAIETSNPKKARSFFGSFLERVVVEEHQVRVDYRPEALLGRPDRTVPSKVIWLPGTGFLGTRSFSGSLPQKLKGRAA